MADLFTQGFFLPAALLALLAWVVPKLLSMALPEGVKSLFLNAFLSSVLLILVSAMFFVFLYVYQGAPLEKIAEIGWVQNINFFGRLAMIAGLIWAPIMILSVANLPRHWVKETW